MHIAFKSALSRSEITGAQRKIWFIPSGGICGHGDMLIPKLAFPDSSLQT